MSRRFITSSIIFDAVRYAAPSQPEKLEQALYQPFAGVLHNDVDGKQLVLWLYHVANIR